ncbi:MAG: 23S rRNA (guanosine(2251)-2'-O)-methyltransferase RlmB [Acidaminococcaceae bacterium]|nr:23S rRNA (guanosine(2251)-2'-O)-methyltransferase RlmB [Acidaminococcaceae bacterium]MBQ9283585.1 23S rRNA (guanosine(2251)-2'-O)-methyltransferase RlmB [Acidaminococcaceae bacterium]MBQ9697930.1 23S rRNA (guanosine(2251)-2'-O)-methyltransferase RlmB [Acidaminococcaceae bacterium]MBR1590775.1 23S rRNA (guanosine(2251)-2'-O)-methyltransferase RlmB [Acidaminococcaceae bacterium]
MTEEIIAGRNAVFEALASRRPVNKIYIKTGTQGGSLERLIAAARDAAVPIEYVQGEKLDKLAAGVRHQGVAALAAPIAFHSLEEVLEQAYAKTGRPFLLLLDELQDPQNVGALIRSADAAGVHGVLLPKRRSCPLNMAVAKVSAGAVNYVPVVQIGNITQTLQALKKQGFWAVGADMDGECQYFEADFDRPVVLVIGAEGKGLGRLVKESCDLLVRIPMQGGVNSLNASAAGAILMYEVVRQRLQGHIK